MFLMPAFSAATVLSFLAGIALAQNDIGLTLPEQVNTVLGDPVTLAASYSTNRQVELLSWYKIDGKDPSKRVLVLSYSPIRGQRTYHNFVERVELAGPASLKILQTRAEDEGKYVLSLLVEEVGSVDGFVTLHILVPPVVEVGPSNPYVIGLGKAALLTCTVMNAKPNISSLHWKKDGTIVDSNLMNTKFSGGTMASPSLMIRHVTRTDAGLYTCVADHVVRQERSSLRLSVLYPSAIISMSDSVTSSLSDRVTLQCVADGNPPPNITWTKNGLKLKSRTHSLSSSVRASSIVLPKVMKNDSGTYLCVATNGVGEHDKKTLELTIKPSALMATLSWNTIAVIIGATAGGLWVVVCVGITMYFIKRRREKKDKEKYAFYYKMGRKQGTDEMDIKDGQTNDGPPGKPPKPPTDPYAGINTIRRQAAKKGRNADRRYAKVLYPYRPTEDNELCLEVDDVIEVLEGEDGGWCLGYLRGRIGLFPSNYATFLTASEASTMKLEMIYQSMDDIVASPAKCSM
ncbi:protein amalgam-like isoform X1 [Branchiostoma lanceolatum]|uniref:protein amalgam-like isoform X1 n=1 Tax=Branchiostoma lanceolatum TaxID=7740 RepID=UPI0034524F7F